MGTDLFNNLKILQNGRLWKIDTMGNIGSSPTDNNWYCQSVFADTDFIHLYLYTIIVTPVLLECGKV